MQRKKYQLAIIGGGFYGCMIALYMKKYFERILIIEKEKNILTKASYNNQARVHNGYHYPRNFVTALRSHVNYEKFITEFKQAVESQYDMVYAISRGTSKSTSQQFIKLCKQIDSPLKAPSQSIKKLFNELLIEDIFSVDEVVFNAAKIREILLKQLELNKITLRLNSQVKRVEKIKDALRVNFIQEEALEVDHVMNCTYAQINTILVNSALPVLPLKYEYAEMPIVDMPAELKNMAITIMDGPFFSLMPFPDKKMHSFHHVRYTPHSAWIENKDFSFPKKTESRFLYMKNDAQRYIPLLKKLQYKESLFELKTVLRQNENNDGRPILFKKDYGLKNFHVVLGGKLDNIYDIFNTLENTM